MIQRVATPTVRHAFWEYLKVLSKVVWMRVTWRHKRKCTRCGIKTTMWWTYTTSNGYRGYICAKCHTKFFDN